MSFILDALRKSEHARQHQKGPALAEVPFVASKPKTNIWAAAAVALLVINLIAVGVLMLRRAQRSEADTPSTAAAAPAATPSATAPLANAGVAGGVNSSAPLNHGPTLDTNPPPTAINQQPEISAPPPLADSAENPLAAEVSDAGPDLGLDPGVAERAANVPDGPPAVTSRAKGGGKVIYATVPEADDAPYSEAPYTPAPVVAAPTPAQSTLPGADEIMARGGVPPMHLDLHVYSNVPGQRFIFVNSRKYKQGDTLQEGPVIEEITPDGAVLNLRGSRFKLSRD